MKFENTDVWGFEHAIRGMRNPMNSWDKSDSDFLHGVELLGQNDIKLAQKLIKAGNEHRKFLRQIIVSFDGNLFFLQSFRHFIWIIFLFFGI